MSETKVVVVFEYCIFPREREKKETTIGISSRAICMSPSRAKWRRCPRVHVNENSHRGRLVGRGGLILGRVSSRPLLLSTASWEYWSSFSFVWVCTLSRLIHTSCECLSFREFNLEGRRRILSQVSFRWHLAEDGAARRIRLFDDDGSDDGSSGRM